MNDGGNVQQLMSTDNIQLRLPNEQETEDEEFRTMVSVDANDRPLRVHFLSANYFIRKHTHYTVENELGKGGQGAVYKVVRKDNATEVRALKLMSRTPSSNLSAVRREVAVLTNLRAASVTNMMSNHSLCHWYDHAISSKWLLLMFQFCRGGDLQHVMKSIYKDSAKVLSLKSVREIGLQLLNALVFLQGQGVMHLDVKPKNVFLEEVCGAVCKKSKFYELNDPKVRLGDFGLAHRIQNEAGDKRSVIGTFSYCAPEVLLGFWDKYRTKHCAHGDQNPPQNLRDNPEIGMASASDIWSLAVTLIQLVHGERLFALVMKELHAKTANKIHKIYYSIGKVQWVLGCVLPASMNEAFTTLQSEVFAETARSNQGMTEGSGETPTPAWYGKPWSPTAGEVTFAQVKQNVLSTRATLVKKEPNKRHIKGEGAANVKFLFDLLDKMLIYSGSSRITAADALTHSFFTGPRKITRQPKKRRVGRRKSAGAPKTKKLKTAKKCRSVSARKSRSVSARQS
ncbi:hypothetical protein RvY_16696 [Ramazzottius varieornatus]|uniref:Protein kinase domain-containing protein n=1 Tax=Ramazzottius varieornatus TaxID=947166 RepID=A0A1D1VZG0_RAMVA|nr:hypothetical protein RvY_16696 [Ramazzottius varieornatus]